jgi:transposase
LLTHGQGAKIDALKSASPDFTTMRWLAMRFRGILQGKDIQKFEVWLNDAQRSRIFRNPTLPESCNGQTEGQINRLKTLKRAMYGRAGTELLRA